MVNSTKQETTANLELGDGYELSQTRNKTNIIKAIEYLEKALDCAKERLDKEQEIDKLIALRYACPLIRERRINTENAISSYTGVPKKPEPA